MKALIEIIIFAQEGIENSKEGLTTYEDDSEADHGDGDGDGDGQQVGRETAYRAVIKKCAELMVKKVS